MIHSILTTNNLKIKAKLASLPITTMYGRKVK